jgi:hypothetical protein
MRKALIVGIDDYPAAPLSGCVNDARAMEALLARNEDASPNFSCRSMTAPSARITKANLREAITLLFADEADVALFYFSGHGLLTELGGFLVTPDARSYDEGVSMDTLLTLANQATKVKEIVLILDCCHSGALGSPSNLSTYTAMLREGVSVLTASRSSQVSTEKNGRGLFSSLICYALQGGAADIIGKVSAASVYSYVDQILGPWDQRPVFKSHVSRMMPLRMCRPEIPLEVLRLLTTYFPQSDYVFPLDPTYEPDAEPDHDEHERIFGHLQKYRDARLLIPVGEQHLYYAAINRKACKLTPLGAFYWRLVNEGRL